MITSLLTRRGQTTVPKAVRIALDLRPGDRIAYVIHENRAVLMRFHDDPSEEDPSVTFAEWKNAANTKAFGKL